MPYGWDRQVPVGERCIPMVPIRPETLVKQRLRKPGAVIWATRDTMNDDRTESAEDAPTEKDEPGGADSLLVSGGVGMDIELISISDLGGEASLQAAPVSDGPELMDVIGCDSADAEDRKTPEGGDHGETIHPPRWTGVATGADVVTPDDVQRDESRFSGAPQAASDSTVFRLNELSVQMNDLLRQFEEKLKYDAHKEKIIDVLHKELQEYKTDLIKKYVTGLIMDLIKVIDDARKMASHFKARDLSAEEQPKLLRALEDVAQDLEDVFQVQGIIPFIADDDRFNPNRQRVVRKIDTDEPSKDKTVAESIAPGYEWDGKVIRREMVSVYSYNPALGA